MDPDQHRQKRSRLHSADGINDLGRREDSGGDDSEQIRPRPQARLSTATAALQNVSLQDAQSSGFRPASNLAQQCHNPTPPASFLSHPFFHQNGVPAAHHSFHPSIDQNITTHSPTPPPSLSVTDNAAERTYASLRPSSTHHTVPATQPSLGSQLINLPLHGSRHVQPSNGLIAGPSPKQIERDAQNSLPEQDVPHYQPTVFPSHQPILPTPPFAHYSHASATGMLVNPVQKAPRPRPIYVPAPDEGRPSNPFTNFNANSTSSQAAGPSFLGAHKQVLDSSQPVSEVGLSTTEQIRMAGGVQSFYQPIRSNYSAAFPYASRFPANERPFDGNWSVDAICPRPPPGYPANHYTSPNRIRNAAFVASRKRKRGCPAVPPPAFIYVRTNNPNFNIFDGILLYPELCFALAANLPVNELLSLYAISKDFHTIIDTRFATVILSQSLRKCPESSRTFPFRCYKYLCRPDPAPRIPHPHPAKQAAGEIRKVPSFRWLKMVLFREKACHEIMTIMAEDGVPLPSRCELALKRMWFLMDIPDNARRIGYMHTSKLITDLDLYFMMCFVVKLDLRFNDPVAPNRYHGLRKILLTQRGLLPLWSALKRSTLLTKHDVLEMWVATKYTPLVEEEGLPMFGVSGEKIGKLRMEYWGERSTHETGKACTFLLRPDQLLMREIVRRKIMFSKHFLRCLLWGYVDIATMENYPPRRWDRRIKELDEEYEDGVDGCGDGGEPADGFKDDLLDIGVKKPISMLVATKDHVRAERMERKRKEDTFLQHCMDWYQEERLEDED